jgi:hypothetical protein
MSYGTSPLTYLDGDFEFGEKRDDGYVELKATGSESVMVANNKLAELLIAVAEEIDLEEAISILRARQK